VFNHVICRTRRPGKGPRQAAAIFRATLDLLVERGYEGLTVEGVAARSKVNKTTIYRWWPSKDALLSAALIESDVLELAVADTGSLRGDLTALVEQVVRLLTKHQGGAIARATLAGIDRPDLAHFAQKFCADRLTREEPIFQRAAARGELPPGTDPSLVVDLLAGAVWYRLLIRQTPVPDDFADRLVTTVLTGISAAHSS
jgi:AcrR family transcriptional regulator